MQAAAMRIMIWRVLLAQIEQVVSAHLGPGRVPGNAPGPRFSRHVSMYLARHVGHQSLAQIGRFYNGRHHTTVLHAITKIERFRKSDESVDALLEVLTSELAAGPHELVARLSSCARSALVEAVANRVMDRLAELQAESVPNLVSPCLMIPGLEWQARRILETERLDEITLLRSPRGDCRAVGSWSHLRCRYRPQRHREGLVLEFEIGSPVSQRVFKCAGSRCGTICMPSSLCGPVFL